MTIEEAEHLMRGAIDMHIHTGPDIFPRLMSDIEAAREAKKAGLSGILIKSHVTITADRAAIATALAEFPVYGAMALNYSVGGLNPHALDVGIRMGIKEVWMPTIHSAQYLRHAGHVPMFTKVLPKGLKGICILKDDGNLVDEVYPILDMIAENDIILGTGHLSPEESLALVTEAKRRGVRRILVTHPLATFVGFTVDQMKEIIRRGATYLEHVFNDVTHQVAHPIRPEVIAEAIKAVGAEHCIMSTDGGQVINPPPVNMMAQFIVDMCRGGIPETDIAMMIKDNPRRILGLQ